MSCYECWSWCNDFGGDWYHTLWLLNAGAPLQLCFLFKHHFIAYESTLIKNTYDVLCWRHWINMDPVGYKLLTIRFIFPSEGTIKE